MSQGHRRPAAATRAQIIEAATALLEERGAQGLSVSAIMRRASVSRTAFYREFSDVYAVVGSVLESVSATLAAEAGDWFTDVDSVGSPSVIHGNALRSGRTIKRFIGLLAAVHDAAGLDERLRGLWHDTIIQPSIHAAAASIRRDQASGSVPPSIDPDATAFALTLMGERIALEVLGRRDGRPEEYAAIISPIWEAVLFGHVDPG